MENILNRLKANANRQGTVRNYHSIWRNFNDFVIRLDRKPKTWEDRTSLFLAFMTEKGAKSATVKSYKSAIKNVLVNDGYEWDDGKILLNAITKACRLKNDIVQTRLPISRNLLELILFEVQRKFINQPYLECLYKAMFLLSFYGLLRIGEVTDSEHVIKAKNIHVAVNKMKILIVLYSSKTHGKGNRPQKVKITANRESKINFFCPFKLMRAYMQLRGNYKNDDEQLFVFHDYTPVKAEHARSVLKDCITKLNLDECLYNYHSMRIGMATQLAKNGKSIEEIKRAGRWRSNTVYKYLKL